ncbi:hypothetical protein DRP05_00185 [Archaeoglobales archaeon]|nr:MAG: hypothetical protein DRP05_00185 [Archaeoglobales archaeon]
MAKSSTGLDENVAGALSYVLGIITGIVFFILEKESDFVKFHAMQSIIVFAVLWIVSFILSYIPLIGWSLSLLVNLIAFVVWIVCIFKAYQGEWFKLPVVGDIAEQQAKKMSA